jgi:hypothetical protein
MRNKEFNPAPYLLNKPTFTSGHRSRSAPHFKNQKYAPGTVGNWTGNLIGQLITNHPKHGNNRFSLAQIFKVRSVRFVGFTFCAWCSSACILS